MDIVKLQVLKKGEQVLVGTNTLDGVSECGHDKPHKTARLLFAGFSQDGALLGELIKSNLYAPLVATNKKVYGPVVKQKSLQLDNIELDHDCYIISNYSQGVNVSFVNDHSEFEVSLIDIKALEGLIERYEEIEIIAWSFGVRVVRALCECLPHLASKITYAVALNGTVLSVDLNYGIDPKAYDLTLERFNVVMHKQFIKNMCAYAQALEIGVQKVEEPQEYELALCSSEDRALVDKVRSLRALEDFQCELKLMPFVKLKEAQDTSITHEPIDELPSCPLVFDEAYVALGDKIITSAAQYHYWSDYALMRLSVLEHNNSLGSGFSLHTFYGPHLCPALMRDLMLCPLHKRAS